MPIELKPVAEALTEICAALQPVDTQNVSFKEAANRSSNGRFLFLIMLRKASRRPPFESTILILRLFFSIALFFAIEAFLFMNELSGTKRELNTTK